jgi:hypothetical protein
LKLAREVKRRKLEERQREARERAEVVHELENARLSLGPAVSFD